MKNIYSLKTQKETDFPKTEACYQERTVYTWHGSAHLPSVSITKQLLKVEKSNFQKSKFVEMLLIGFASKHGL